MNAGINAKSKKINIQGFWACLVVVSFPFWALPFLPGSFKPISIFFAAFWGFGVVLYRVFYIKVISRVDLILLCFMFFALANSVGNFIFWGGETDIFFQSNTIFIIGVLSYFGFKNIIDYYSFHKFILLFVYPITIVVIIGWIDLLCWVGILPYEIKALLDMTFSGKVSGRIALTVSEPAWASRLCLILLPISYFICKFKINFWNRFCFYSLWVFFVACFSLSGIVVFLCSAFVYVLCFKLNYRAFLKALVVFCVLFSTFYLIYNSFKEQEDSYYFSRFEKIDKVNIENLNLAIGSLAALDGSVFIRVSYPIIAFRISYDNLLGVGIGRYGLYFADYMKSYGEIAMQNETVAKDIDNKNANQRTYFGKLLSENGIILTSLLLMFYILPLKKLLLKENNFEYKNERFLLVLLASVMFGNMIQFASYLFPIYWLLPALIESLLRKKTMPSEYKCGHSGLVNTA